MRFGLIGGSYTSRSSAVAGEECINWFPETRETSGGVSPSREYGGAGTGGTKSLYWTPGLQFFSSLGGTPRAQLVANQRLFVVAGSAFGEVAPSGALTTLGTVANDGRPATLAFNGAQIFIVSAGKAYCYTLAWNYLLDVTSQMQAVPEQGVFVDSYFGVKFQNSRKMQWSDVLDGMTWPGENVGEPSVFAENVVSMAVNHREVWVFGSRHAQVYQNTGNAEIFDVIPGAFVEVGCAATFAPCLLDNSVFWVSEDDRGGCMAWRSNGYTPQRISTHAVEIDLRSNATLEGMTTYAYQDGGHSFWVLYVPNSQWSWVYDVSEGVWHKRASWDGNKTGPHNSWNHAYAFGRNIVGDWASGNLYTLTQNAFDDNGAVIRRVRRAPIFSDEMKFIRHSKLALDFEMGNVSRVLPTDVSPYADACYGPNYGGSAVRTPIADAYTWLSPNRALANGSYANVQLRADVNSGFSNTATGTSEGGGVPWTNPANVTASGVTYASVSLSSGAGATVVPSQTAASVGVSANPSNQNPADDYNTLSGFASTPATGATLYVTVNGSFSSAQGGGALALSISYDSGTSWSTVNTWGVTFGPTTLPINVTGITNLNTLRLQLKATAHCGPSGFANASGGVSNWYAVLQGTAQPTAQTLVATMSGLSLPAGTDFLGLGISLNADYTGVAPTFQVALNVGNIQEAITLTTTPTVYTVGGSADKWGYDSWDSATLASLKVYVYATSTGTTTVNANELTVTAYYTNDTIFSDDLDVTQFGFALPPDTTPQGITASLVAYASQDNATLTVQPLKAGVPTGNAQTIALPTVETEFSFGGDTNLLGVNIPVANFGDPDFGLRITAQATGGQTVYAYVKAVRLKVFAPLTTPVFNYIGPDPVLTDGDGNPRPPQAMVRWSDDRGQTWSNEHIVDLGNSGQTKVRAILRRLGRSRYRVYEVVASDPIPWVLTDGYLEASE